VTARDHLMRGVALALSCALATMLVAALGSSATWTGWLAAYPPLRDVPAQGLALVVALGLAFRQSRVAGLAMALLAIFFRTPGVSLSPESPMAEAQADFILVASVWLPVFAIVFHWWDERYLFSVRGALYVAAMAAVAVALYFLPVTGLAPWLARPLDAMGWMGGWLPLAGVLALTVAASLLLWPRAHDRSPGGALFLLAACGSQAALAIPLCPWERLRAETLTPAFFLAATLALGWAILDAAWRHANLDELTGLPGRRPLRDHLAALGSSYSIAVVDIDHFKRINDRYGHVVGDQVLLFVATTLRDNRAGRVYRSGGEEFTILCTRGEPSDHAKAMEELRRAVERKRFALRAWNRPSRKPHQDETPPSSDTERRTLRLTVSIGVAASRDGARVKPHDTLKAADQAMYRAKDTGRNRVCLAD
jgi:GGDEF domain-containing protein